MITNSNCLKPLFMKRLFRECLFLIIITAISLLILSCGSENKENSTNNNSTPKIEQQTANINENKSVENDSTNTQTNPVTNNQTNQSTELSQCKVPILKGFFLGQTVDEVDKRIQGFKDSYEKEKETSNSDDKKANFVLMTSGTLIQAGDESNNIKDFSLVWHFLDDKAMTIIVKYSNDNTSDINDFVGKMSNEYNLPKDGWKIENNNAELSCDGFQINVSTNPQSSPSIMITDTIAEKEKNNRLK